MKWLKPSHQKHHTQSLRKNWKKSLKRTYDHTFIKFPAPSRVIFYAGSGSGKTTIICKILERHKTLFVQPIDKLVSINPMLGEQCVFAPHNTVVKLWKIFPRLITESDVPMPDDITFGEWLTQENIKK